MSANSHNPIHHYNIKNKRSVYVYKTELQDLH